MIFEPQGRLQKASLRARVTWLAAFCVAGAVALVSFGAYMIVRKSVYDALDDSLRSRAATVATGGKVTTPDEVENFPAAFLAAGDVKMGLLQASTGQILYPKGSERPPTVEEAWDVAQGERSDFLWTDHKTESRVIAVKYAPGASPLRVELAGSGPKVTLTVRDDGPGIPTDEQQAVFEKFVRGEAARSAGIKGTGVGLALSRQIARAHGGDLTLQSEPGRGAAFTVTLPAARAAAAAARAEVR